MNQLQQIQQRIQQFADERDWQQFHSPKNISMALAVEASELMEHFQWMSQQQSRNLTPEQTQEVADEIADVFLYLLRMCEQTGVDLFKAANNKIDKNAIKYPVEKSRGTATKYNRL